MGNGRLLQGIGYGDATVWNPNQQVQNFTNILAQQKQEQAAKDQALLAQLAMIKPDGIRTPDTEDFQNKYNDYKNAYIAANQLPKNSRERLSALAGVQQKYGDLNTFIANSKAEKAREASVSNVLLQQPHLFSDNAHQQLINSMNTAMSGNGFIKGNDYNTLERYIDPTKMDKLYSDFKTGLVKTTQFDNGVQTKGRQGDKSGVFVTQKRGIPMDGENGALNNLLNLATIHPDFRKYIGERYKDIQAENPQQQLALQLRQYANDRGDTNGFYETTKPNFKANRPPKEWSLLDQWNFKHYGTPNAPKADNSDGRDLFIQQIEDGDKMATDGLVSEVARNGGKVIPNKNGFEIVLPKTRTENVYKLDSDGKPTNEVTGTKKVQTEQRIVIPRDNSEISKAKTNEVLNELGLFKDRRMYVKKDNPYTTKKTTPSNPVNKNKKPASDYGL